MAAALRVKGLRVKDLRSELQKRGLEKNGVKSTLVARLEKAIQLENMQTRDDNAKKEDSVLLSDAHRSAPNTTGKASANLLQQILDAVHGIDARLRSLEKKMTDQVSFITEHIGTQNDNLRRVDEERKSLQKVTELLTNTADLDEGKATTSPMSHVPNIPTENRFEILSESEADNTTQSYDEQIADYRKRHRTRKAERFDVIVAGDSMLRPIDGSRLSRRKKVGCQPHPGARVEHISPVNVCNSLRSEGEAIIHAGTNNGMEGPRSVHDKIVSWCDAVFSTGRRAAISGIIHRRWETPYERKRIDTLNRHLQTTAEERGWRFIDNSNVGERHLSADGVHLNKSGQRVFAGNLSRYINGYQRYPRRHEHMDQRKQDDWMPRSYAETCAVEESTTPRGSQQGFNMEFQRSRRKTSSHQPMRGQHSGQWQDYLQFVRRVTSTGSH